jgi:hypothetical protein
MSQPYFPGQPVELTAEFSQLGAFVDPTTVKLYVWGPDNSLRHEWTYTVAPELIRTVQGKYQARVVVDVPGTWFFRWESLGNYQAAMEGSFQVARSKKAA